MQAIFGLHFRTLSDWILRTLSAIVQKYKNVIKWPSDEEFKNLKSEFNPQLPRALQRVVCAVDGTEIRISRPSAEEHQSSHYSSKKKQHALNVLLVVDLRGRILYVGKPVANLNDQSVWNASRLRERFEGKTYGIIADGGFHLNPKNKNTNIKGATPVRRLKGTKLSKADRKFNQTLSQWRVVVENAIGQVKKWGILGGKLRHYTAGGPNTFPTDKIVDAVCILTQRKLLQKPLRPENWVNDTQRVPKDFGDEFVVFAGEDDEPAEETPPPKRAKSRKTKK
jgi:hypothetical protein